MGQPDPTTTTITVRLPLELVRRLDNASREKYTSRSETVRICIDRALKRYTLSEADVDWVASETKRNIKRRGGRQ